MSDAPDDDMLMRVADDEADAAEMARVAAAADADPAVAARLAAFRRTRALAREAFPIAQDVPPALVGAILAADAASRPRAQMPVPARRRMLERPWAMATAAAVLLVVGGVAGRLLPAGSQLGLTSIPPALAAVLETAPSGTERVAGAATVIVVGTHPVPGGPLCRDFEVTEAGRRQSGLACRENGGWQLRIAVARPGADGAYRPASGDSLVQTMLERLDATAVLDGAAEQALIARGWQR